MTATNFDISQQEALRDGEPLFAYFRSGYGQASLTPTRVLTLAQLLSYAHSDQAAAALVELHESKAHDSNHDYQTLKRRQPCIQPCGLINSRAKGSDRQFRGNGLAQIDIDDPGEGDYDLVRGHPSIVYIQHSSSGGIKALARVRVTDDEDVVTACMVAIANDLRVYDVVVDPAIVAKHVMFLFADPNAYLPRAYRDATPAEPDQEHLTKATRQRKLQEEWQSDSGEPQSTDFVRHELLTLRARVVAEEHPHHGGMLHTPDIAEVAWGTIDALKDPDLAKELLMDTLGDVMTRVPELDRAIDNFTPGAFGWAGLTKLGVSQEHGPQSPVEDLTDVFGPELLSGEAPRKANLVIKTADQALRAKPPLPDPLIEGLLPMGSFLVLGASSKVGKTWSLLDAAVSATMGGKWLGFDYVRRCKVLVIDMELGTVALERRIWEVGQARRWTRDDQARLSYFSMKGVSIDSSDGAPLKGMMDLLTAAIKTDDFDLVVLDPLYNVAMLDTDGAGENDNASMGRILTQLGACSPTASVIVSHHFSKGSQSNKDPMDRFSGAGTIARYPDALVTMTSHELDDHFVVESVARHYKHPRSFVVERVHPVMVERPDEDPDLLRSGSGAPPKVTDQNLVALFEGDEQLTVDQIATKSGLSRPQAGVRLRELESVGLLTRSKPRPDSVSRAQLWGVADCNEEV